MIQYLHIDATEDDSATDATEDDSDDSVSTY